MHNSMNATIDFENVRYCYGEVCAINGASFSLPLGSMTALVGPNGGGKSTLIKLLAGLLKPDEGTVRLPFEMRVSYVPQGIEFDTTFPLTVRELVMMGTLQRQIRPFHRYSQEQKRAAAMAIAHVGLTEYENRGIGQLSGGQLKRAVIARVLASNAAVIVLDEPDADLDIDAARDVYAVLGNLKGEKTILMASHHIDTALELADIALYVKETVVVFDDPKTLKDRLKGGMML